MHSAKETPDDLNLWTFRPMAAGPKDHRCVQTITVATPSSPSETASAGRFSSPAPAQGTDDVDVREALGTQGGSGLSAPPRCARGLTLGRPLPSPSGRPAAGRRGPPTSAFGKPMCARCGPPASSAPTSSLDLHRPIHRRHAVDPRPSGAARRFTAGRPVALRGAPQELPAASPSSPRETAARQRNSPRRARRRAAGRSPASREAWISTRDRPRIGQGARSADTGPASVRAAS
jgi:hypothetical protein